MASFARVTVTPPETNVIRIRGGGVPGRAGASVVTVEQVLVAQQTAGDGQPVSGAAIAATPFAGSAIDLSVNGISFERSEGAFYFSRDGGASEVPTVEQGDTVHWRASVAGFSIEPDDDLVLRFERASV